MTKGIFKRLCAFILVCFMAVSIFGIAPSSVPAAAKTISSAFDNSNVLDDLKSSTVDGKLFKLSDYPFDSTGIIKKPSIINFVEFCYSFNSEKQGYYGLYVYFYNPGALNIDTSSKSNKIQLAVSYKKDGTPDDYEKFDLSYCNKSEGSDYSGLFYKFKVVDPLSGILERINTSIMTQQSAGISINECVRRYDVSGGEFIASGESNAIDYSGGTYSFKGYAKGFGADVNAESSLTCSVNELETIELELRNTNYRTESSSTGKDHKNELNSVYFSVDNRIIEKYGKLQKIKAAWYEYKTKPIVVTSDIGLANAVESYIGKNIGEHTDSLKYDLGYNKNVFSGVGSVSTSYDWTYNVDCYQNVGMGGTTIVSSKEICDTLNYIFYENTANINDYFLPGERLEEYIKTYDKSFDTGKLPIKKQDISADLFMDTIDSARMEKGYKVGENTVEIDADSKFDLFSYTEANKGFWDKVGDYGFWDTLFGKTPTDENITGILPIYKVKDSDLMGNALEISERLLINKRDIEDTEELPGFVTYFNQAAKSSLEFPLGKSTYLFRYAATDYFAGKLSARKLDDSKLLENAAYMAQETVFLDFDIIQLTFNRDGVYKVIPVVSNPIDIIPGLDPPPDYSDKGNGCADMLSMIVILIVVVVLFVLLLIFLPIILPVLPAILSFILKILWWILKILFYIVTSPFWIIRAIVRKVKEK